MKAAAGERRAEGGSVAHSCKRVEKRAEGVERVNGVRSKGEHRLTVEEFDGGAAGMAGCGQAGCQEMKHPCVLIAQAPCHRGVPIACCL